MDDMNMDTHAATNLQSEGWASVFDSGGRGSSLVGTHTAGPGNITEPESSSHSAADLEDLALAESRLRDIRSGKTQAIPLEDVLRQYGMES